MSEESYFRRLLAASLLVLGLIQCGNSSGTLADGGIDGPIGDGPIGATCTVAVSPVEVPTTGHPRQLQVANNRLFFIDKHGGTQLDPGGLLYSASIHSMNMDGTDNQELYAAPGDRRVFQMVADGSRLFLLIGEFLRPSGQEARVYSLPFGGGTPTLLTTTTDGYDGVGSYFFGMDASALYLFNGQLIRVDKNNGNETKITMAGVFQSLQVVGSNIWYQGTDNGMWGIFKIGTAASNGTPTLLGLGDCFPEGLRVASNGLLCGKVDSIVSYDFDFKNPATFVEFPHEQVDFFGGIGTMKVDGDQIYFHKHHESLYRVAQNGGNLQLLACKQELIDEFQLAPDAIFWLRSDDIADNRGTHVLRLPK